MYLFSLFTLTWTIFMYISMYAAKASLNFFAWTKKPIRCNKETKIYIKPWLLSHREPLKDTSLYLQHMIEHVRGKITLSQWQLSSTVPKSQKHSRKRYYHPPFLYRSHYLLAKSIIIWMQNMGIIIETHRFICQLLDMDQTQTVSTN